MENYVVGFMFSKNKERVVLIRKNRPEWQKGFFNGVGGHIEKDETPIEAMIREFKEEAGILRTDWVNFCIITYKDCVVWFFKCFVEINTLQTDLKSCTDEKVSLCYLYYLPKVIPNLDWIIPLALDPYIDKTISYQVTP